MTRVDQLPRDTHNLANNERHRLVLHFSRNLVDWCFAGVVAIGNSPRETRCYAGMSIAGNDLVICARSGSLAAASQRDTDLITFHRVQDFRYLIY